MNEEIKNAVDDLGQAFVSFKQANDQRLREIERTGSVDPLTDAKVNRLNGEITRAQMVAEKAKSRVDMLETALNRSHIGDVNMGSEQKHAQSFMIERQGKIRDVNDYMGYKSALKNYLRKNNSGSDLEEIKSLSAGSDPDGGYWVTPDISGRIASLVHETSPMRSVANVVTIGTDKLEGTNDIDEAAAGWVTETGARTETNSPQVGQYSIEVHEQYAEPRATQKLLDDAMFNVDEWLATKIADKFTRMENTAFVHGDGSGKPKGFLTYAAGIPSTSNYDVVEQINSGAAGAFASSNPGDNLINLVFSLKANYRDNAVFMMKRSTLSEVRKLKDSDGNYLWTPDFQLKQGGTLLGFNIVEAEDMPEIAADSLSIAFGDFNSGYQIVDRHGVRILRDSFTTKPFVKFYTTKRVGGAVTNFEAIKLMKFAA